MNNFFKLLFASCLGTLLALGVLILLGIITVSSIASKFGTDEVDLKANSVLLLKPGLMPELTDNLETDPFAFEEKHIIGLRDMLRIVEDAKSNDDIKGIYLDLSGLAIMPATSSALRKSLLSFRESGKFIVCHSKYYSQGAYYLASVADGLYLNPTGELDIRGFGATIPFLKEGLDKLGVDVNVIYAGDFKSAGEPFFRNSMSDSNRLQTRAYLDDLWNIWLTDVAEARNIPFTEVKRLTENYLIRNDKEALEYKFVDAIYYKDQVLDNLRERIGLDKDEDIVSIEAEDYFKKLSTDNPLSKKQIGIIYAEGNIVDGKADPGSIGDGDYVKLISEMRKSDKIKAIVLRVNSGGGSAMASENIWRELQLARDQGIPVVTSMGDVAASGGYYIAMATDSIFAQPNTITGSIGVIGLLPNFSRLMDDKLGINFDTVNTGKFSNAFSPIYPLTSTEREIMQEGVDEIYAHFIQRVADGRKMENSLVGQLAKGRVWTGKTALELGLVDRMGGLDDAIATAARMAGLDLDEVRIKEYPQTESARERILKQLMGEEDDENQISITSSLLRREFGSTYEAYKQVKMLSGLEGPQMILLDQLRAN